ncbi:hypothetical protein BDV12DRAFT_194411 [Aspergillus spectabilis]
MSSRECTFASKPSSTPDSLPLSSPSPSSSSKQSPKGDINLTHMELLLHLTSTKEIFSLGDGLEPYSTGVTFALKTGLHSPYLFYELLAFSACHLAYLSSSQADNYLHQAITLQTRAISLFNVEKLQVTQSNCVAILLFTVVLGHHLLADTLRKRDFESLTSFLDHYIQCAATHRGIFTVLTEAKPLLMETELSPVLSRSVSFTSSQPKGHYCDRLSTLIHMSPTLTYEEKIACHSAIRYLQLGFDALIAPADAESTRYQMLFLWTVVVPPEFMALVARKKPEALVIFAYYARLLCRGRHIWQVGEAGVYIFDLVKGELGHMWDRWLE